jgi:hypothetical protein
MKNLTTLITVLLVYNFVYAQNVGIGNSDPGYPLDVSGRIRIRSGGGANSAGLYLNRSDNLVQLAFVGMQSNSYVGFFSVPLNTWGMVMNINNGNVGIGTTNPTGMLSVSNEATNVTASFTNSNASNTAAIVQATQAGTGAGMVVQLSNGANGARGISVEHSGVGPGVFASSAGGNAVWGVTSSISAAGVIGDNTYGEAVVGRNKGGTGVGAVVGRNDSSGYGVRGFNTKNGIGVLGQTGISGGTGIAGLFQNVNNANPSNALEARTNGAGSAAFFTNTGTGPAMTTGNGNVGIGNSSPGFPLDVNGRIRIRSGGNPNTAGLYLNKDDNTTQQAFIGMQSDDHVGFFGVPLNAWGMLMNTNNGNVGIGNTNPEYSLDVGNRMRLRGGGDLANSPGIWLNNVDNSGQLAFMGVYNNNYIGWYGTGGASWTLMMNINNGYIGIGTQNPTEKLHVNGNICYTGSIAACSDIRYKKNIIPLSEALNSVMKINGIYYNWDKEKFSDKSFNDERQLGFSAQEIQKLFPEIVQTDSKGYMAVDYSRLTPVLVEAIKEQQQHIATQDKQIDQLKEAVFALQQLVQKKL